MTRRTRRTRTRFGAARRWLALGALLLWAAGMGPLGGLAAAAEKPKTRRVQAASPKVFKQLKAAHDLIDTERYPEALRALDELAKNKKLSAYEQSLVHQTYGFVYAALERYPEAIKAFERCLGAGGMAPSQALNIQYNMAQLYLATEQYAKGVKALQAWFNEAENPAPDAYILMANAELQLEHYDAALRWAEQGVAKTSEPRESWLQLLLALYFEKKQYREVAQVLERLLARFPKKTYWVQLSAVYGELKQEAKSLAAYELAYRQKLLDKSDELVRLAQLYLYHEVPYKAGKLLEAGLASGAIEGDARTWELLADSWLYAREFERAVEPLRRAAELSEDGNLYVRLAQVHFENESWELARQALRGAFKKGKLKEPGQAHLLLGIASLQLSLEESSREAFVAASKYEKTRKSANQWLRHLESEAAVSQ